MSMETYNKYKCFMFFTRKYKFNELRPPRDLKEAFDKFAGGGAPMSADQLHRFLVECQGQVDCTLFDSRRIVEKVFQERRQHQKSITTDQHKEQGLTLHDLFHFLLLDDFNGPLKSEVHHEMSAPLSHYFIYTGHNSYLTGNQLSSKCSDKPIIKSLQRGVRAIELDLWPTSNKKDIKVVHGWTFTNPVSLIRCLKSIKKYAFVASQYPVIITIEDHLTQDLRAKFAKMATEIFGETLYYPQEDCLTEFPSPESLKNRIIISTKPPKKYRQSNSINDKGNNPVLNGTESSDEESSGEESPESLAELKTEDRGRQNGGDQDEGDANAFEHKSYQQAAPDYKGLITIHNRKIKGSLKDNLKIDGEVRRLSLKEERFESAAESHGTDIVRFTQKHILRVYPSGKRVQSSNFKPHIGWMYGAQMVAFNMQGHGKQLRLMQGMFRANGGSGYVKKPQVLMQKHPQDKEFDPESTFPVKKTLKVKVYMGHGWSLDFSRTYFDKCSPPDFYVKVCIVGVPADSAKKKTRAIMDNWFPVWDEEFEFPLTFPELALLRIEVREKDQGKDDFAGQTCLPISELGRGFRSIPLYNKKGDKYKSVKLLMQFQFE